MSRIVLALLAIVVGGQLQAQETGIAAVNSSATAKNNDWQNWVFFGTALVTLTGGILAVSLDNGSLPPKGSSH